MGLIDRQNLLEDGARSDPQRRVLAANARRALAALELDPATTAEALMEMLPLAPSQDDTDWIITALCVLYPEAAADPRVSQRLARREGIESARARARAGSLSWSEAVAA